MTTTVPTARLRKVGRPYYTHTPLGQVMAERGLHVWQVGHGTRINTRTMTEYLAGRKQIPPRDVGRLSAFFDLAPEEFTFNAEDYRVESGARVSKGGPDAQEPGGGNRQTDPGPSLSRQK